MSNARIASQEGPADSADKANEPNATAKGAQYVPEQLDSKRQRSLARLDKLAWFLDDSIPIPFSRFRVGFDALIGIVPGVGDLVTTGISLWMIAVAVRNGAPKNIVGKMLGNTLVEFVVGIVPGIGDLFDAAFKANKRNMKLLRTHLEPEPPKTNNKLLWLIVVLAGSAALILAVYAGMWLAGQA